MISQMIAYTLTGISVLVFFMSIIKIPNAQADKESNKYVITAIMSVLVCGASLYSLESYKVKKEAAILEKVSQELNANESEVVVEDISESSFFSNKNKNLRKVIHKGKTYVVQVNDHKIIKLTNSN